MEVRIEKSWKEALTDEFDKPYFKELADFVRTEYASKKVYPPPKFVFNAFELTPFNDVSVIILGQDPYHGAGQAHGLSFSVPDGLTLPPSLKNIYKELEGDLGMENSSSGNLERWAEQGVFLLNATLTVVAHTPGSHQHKGWETFTNSVITTLSDKKENLVFLLWGRYAQNKRPLIDESKHLVLTAAHPSPFSAFNGFFGCKHFSQANNYLESKGLKPVSW
jgi:uracil-DNA glycosylase